ncbi:hypothetical protein P7K49_006861 [Saguinus oedipus]|uniref:Uncharacterized protein n=1 Tax=Saguinus oedipus TaxID=9490 RepID=A0ABQ9W4D9_SAGOE|nr:hypothetical protein P7K49_006861 [Saguinus oedipus]
MEFRKLSVTKHFGAGSPRACTAKGEGNGLTEFARGQRRGGPPASRMTRVRVPGREPSPSPGNDFIFFEEQPSWAAVATCLVQPRALHPGTLPGREAAEGKGWRPERESGLPNWARGLLRGVRRPHGAARRTAPTLRSRKGKGKSAGQVSQLRGRMQAVAGRDGATVPFQRPRPGGAPFSACAPPRSARSRRRDRGCRAPALAQQPATRVGDSGCRGARRRAARCPPLHQRSGPSAPPPQAPEKCLYLPPPPPPSRRRYPWRLGTLPSSGLRGCLPSLRVLPAAERALGLASLEEEEEEEQSGLARAASPYNPFNSLAFSFCCSSPLGCRLGRRRRCNFLLPRVFRVLANPHSGPAPRGPGRRGLLADTWTARGGSQLPTSGFRGALSVLHNLQSGRKTKEAFLPLLRLDFLSPSPSIHPVRHRELHECGTHGSAGVLAVPHHIRKTISQAREIVLWPGFRRVTGPPQHPQSPPSFGSPGPRVIQKFIKSKRQLALCSGGPSTAAVVVEKEPPSGANEEGRTLRLARLLPAPPALYV